MTGSSVKSLMRDDRFEIDKPGELDGWGTAQ